MKSEIDQQIIDDARKAWAGLSQAERTEYFDIAKENNRSVRSNNKLLRIAFGYYVTDYYEHQRLAKYRKGPEGIIQWVEDNVRFKVPFHDADGNLIHKWLHVHEFPIEGGSIDMARAFARNYGNNALPRIFRQRKGQIISGKMAQSKAIRNAILQVMPRWMIEKLIALAKDSQLQSIVDLRAMARSVKDGEVTADSLFPEIESELKKPESKPPESKKSGRKPTNKKQPPEDRWQEIVKTDSKGALEVLDAFKAAHRDKETDFAWCVERYEKRN